MERSATVIWKGTLKEGRGLVTTKSRTILEVPFTFGNRFRDEIGLSPEELIAAAHASCFSMALSSEIGKENAEVKSIHTTAIVTLENKADVWNVIESHLDVGAEILGINDIKFKELAEKAKKNCPISRLLNIKITLNAKLWNKERVLPIPPSPGEL